MSRFSRNTLLAAAAMTALCSHLARAQGSDSSAGAYPFTKQENLDGARYIWFIFARAGFPFKYTPARSFPPAREFREINARDARQSDVVWWPTLLAGYSGPTDRRVQVAEGSLSLDSLIRVKGQPKFFRKQVPDRPAQRGRGS
jgi:hypothetical protein